MACGRDPVGLFFVARKTTSAAEEKEFVKTEKQGKLLRFTPLIAREEYTQQYLTEAKNTFFGGSPTSLVSFFVNHEQLNDDEISELLRIIKEKQGL